MTAQEQLNHAVLYALREGCFFPVLEPSLGASVRALVQWGAMHYLHKAIKEFASCCTQPCGSSDCPVCSVSARFPKLVSCPKLSKLKPCRYIQGHAGPCQPQVKP